MKVCGGFFCDVRFLRLTAAAEADQVVHLHKQIRVPVLLLASAYKVPRVSILTAAWRIELLTSGSFVCVSTVEVEG